MYSYVHSNFYFYLSKDDDKVRHLEKLIRLNNFTPIIIADYENPLMDLCDKVIDGILKANYLIRSDLRKTLTNVATFFKLSNLLML